jgi:hypothetical protein
MDSASVESLAKNTPLLATNTQKKRLSGLGPTRTSIHSPMATDAPASILYNWLRGSLPEPIHPPNLWNDPSCVYPEYPPPIL